MKRSNLTLTLTLALLILPASGYSIPNGKIMGYKWLLSALKNNHPPTGYLDLNNCKMIKNISDLPTDRRTYRISFKENYSYDPDNGNITTIMNILYQQTKELGGTPVLMSRPATTILSSKPAAPFMDYQIVMSHGGKTMMQLYQCPWEKSVYLWKERTSRF